MYVKVPPHNAETRRFVLEKKKSDDKVTTGVEIV